MNDKLVLLIKTEMTRRGLSLRGLGELCGISASTLSRIFSGKQPAGVGHLRAFSEHLGIPFDRLLGASGFDTDSREDENSRVFRTVIRKILKSYDIEFDEVLADIKKNLKKYERYARSEEGEREIFEKFPQKISEIKGEGEIIDKLHRLFELFSSDLTDERVKILAGSALLYFILMPDVIPDYAFPLGYLDDAIAVELTSDRIWEEFGMC